jgi:hypothetical protein
MLRPLSLVLFACLVAVPLCAGAAESGPATLPPTLQRAQEAAREIPALRLGFVQTKHLAILDEPLTTPGVMEIDRRAGALRWEFTGQAVLILAAGHLRRWGPDGREENLGNDPAAQALAGQMQALLTGDWAPLATLFKLSEEPAGTVVLTPLTPDIGRFIARLTLTFTPTGVPASLVLETAGGDRTEYQFAVPDTTWHADPARFQHP